MEKFDDLGDCDDREDQMKSELRTYSTVLCFRIQKLAASEYSIVLLMEQDISEEGLPVEGQDVKIGGPLTVVALLFCFGRPSAKWRLLHGKQSCHVSEGIGSLTFSCEFKVLK